MLDLLEKKKAPAKPLSAVLIAGEAEPSPEGEAMAAKKEAMAKLIEAIKAGNVESAMSAFELVYQLCDMYESEA